MVNFLQGTWTALITPFLADAEYSVDYEGFKKLLDFQMQNGVTGLVPCGTTGESATMSHDTHRDVIKFVMEYTKANAAKFGRKLGEDLFVMPGTGSNATDEAIELTKHAERLGAHATLHVTPYYNKPTMEGMKLHFKLITDSSRVPIVIYNIPGRTGKNLEVPTLLEIAKNPQVIGIKEASGDIGQIMKIIYKTRSSDFSVLSGDDNLTYLYMALGGKGVVSVASNVIPRQMSDFTATMLAGDWKKGLDLHWKLLDFFEALFYETNPGPVKYMASIRGLPSGPMRPPMCTPTPDNQERIKKAMKALGLFS